MSHEKTYLVIDSTFSIFGNGEYVYVVCLSLATLAFLCLKESQEGMEEASTKYDNS